MCNPAFIPMAIMAVGAAVQTGVQIDSSNKQSNAISESAQMAANADYMAIEEGQQEAYRSNRLEKFERMRQGMRERAKMRVSAGESGVAGISPYRDQVNSFLQESYDKSIMNDNAMAKVAQGSRESAKVSATATGRGNEARAMHTPLWLSGLQISNAGASGAMQGMSMGSSFGSSSSAFSTPQNTLI